MRRILIGSAAAVLAMTLAPAPALAQYGGSPDGQVEGPAADEDGDAISPEEDEPNEAADPGEAEDYGADASPDDGVDLSPDPEDQGAFQEEGPPPEDADADADVDVDVDEGEAEDGGTWQGEDGRSYCRRSDGTTGLIVGGGAGALIGRGIDSHGRRGTGTVIGAIAGALVGSAVERSANEQRCR